MLGAFLKGNVKGCGLKVTEVHGDLSQVFLIQVPAQSLHCLEPARLGE